MAKYHVRMVCADEYKIEANSEDEAKQIARDMFKNNYQTNNLRRTVMETAELNKYYAVTVNAIFTKTVLVPIDEVAHKREAIDLVEKALEDNEIEILEGEAEYDVDCDGESFEVSDVETAQWQIVRRES